MKVALRKEVYVIIAVSLLLGCAHQNTGVLSPVSLPNEIFSIPGTNSYGTARVGLFAFSGPDYAPDMGPIASQILCNELQKTRAFRDVIYQPTILNMTIGNLINVARIKRYDLIITGKLLRYFEGSSLEASSVIEEIRVIRVRGGKPRILWHAKASETGFPVPSRDFIFFLSEGRPAPSAATLMRINAEKFCKMILDLPPRVDQQPYPTRSRFSNNGVRPEINDSPKKLDKERPPESDAGGGGAGGGSAGSGGGGAGGGGAG